MCRWERHIFLLEYRPFQIKHLYTRFWLKHPQQHITLDQNNNEMHLATNQIKRKEVIIMTSRLLLFYLFASIIIFNLSFDHGLAS